MSTSQDRIEKNFYLNLANKSNVDQDQLYIFLNVESGNNIFSVILKLLASYYKMKHSEFFILHNPLHLLSDGIVEDFGCTSKACINLEYIK